MNVGSTLRIQIPHLNLAGGGADMRTRLLTWIWKTRLQPKTTDLELDFSENRFIEPWALAQFTAYGLLIRETHRIPVRAILSPKIQPTCMLSRWGSIMCWRAVLQPQIGTIPNKTRACMLSEPIKTYFVLLRVRSNLVLGQTTKRWTHSGTGWPNWGETSFSIPLQALAGSRSRNISQIGKQCKFRYAMLDVAFLHLFPAHIPKSRQTSRR